MAYWDSDPYQVYIWPGAAMSPAEQAALDTLERAASATAERPANIQLHLMDSGRGVATSAPHHPPDNLPALVVYYPAPARIREPLWTGPLTPENVAALLDSPLRRQLADYLRDGHTAVWILLESGRRRQDDQTFQLAAAELQRLEGTLYMSIEQDVALYDLPFNPGAVPPGTISFRLLRLSRDDPAEAMLVRMLLGSEADLDDFSNQPILFPVYGRGLILYALVGAGINAHTLATAGQFLTGPCSCQVKASNPGTDLLMTAAWTTGRAAPPPPAAPPALTGLGDFDARTRQAQDLADTWTQDSALELVVTAEIADHDQPTVAEAAADSSPAAEPKPLSASAPARTHSRNPYLVGVYYVLGAALALTVIGSLILYRLSQRKEGRP